MHEKWMKRALELAENGRGWTSPNPEVGAVLVKDGQIVGEGFHHLFGAPHAEIEAIRNAGENVAGSTLYVSLEPCCYFGKTPPCVETIIRSGIHEVVVATIDPNPKVNGEGIRALRNSGISVTVGILGGQAKESNRGFFSMIQKNRPWVTLKLGLTADGFIADVTGKSRWITSKPSRVYVKEQRLKYDAIMVGMGTVFKDDPSLLPENRTGYIPYRVILDDVLNMPFRMKLVSDEYKQRTVLVVSTGEKEEKIKQMKALGVHVIRTERNELGWIDLNAALEALAGFGINSIFCEGGGQVAGSLVSERLIDELQVFIAPKILGTGIMAFSGLMKSLDEAIQLKWNEPVKMGEDIFIKGTLV
ncbi:MAG: bifunctional diaminohydroxyphosphoribosylaminopyrimidine deaminase/5-amino-6-(5-phosphoribosylamino)uracil reductase RibD [Candidatus Marinimicrobia bacterium]|nr:bifunctional diaminohydroxyphosphoribosylaminopyrimidine deaminase/5-amino-6-(5-phosphoribosylamino)uracil reductase RibD [Candidatus Neomarinimicrobiota bacterium]